MNKDVLGPESPGHKTSESIGFTRDIIWVSLAQLFNSLIFGIVTMPALTKAYPSEVFGAWVQINITITLLSPCIALQLGMAVVRFLSGVKDLERIRQSLSCMLLVITAVSLVVLIAANLLAPQLSNLLFARPDYEIYVRLTFIWLFFNVYFNFFISYLRARNKIRLLSIRQVIVAVITMALVIGLSSRGLELKWIISSVIVVQAVFVFIFFGMAVREVGWPVFNLSGLKSYMAFSFPQMPGGILLWLIRFSDRYFITHFLGLSATAIYSSSNTLAGLTNIFHMPISFVLYPMLSRLWEEKKYDEVKNYLEYSTRLFLTIAIPGSVGIAVLSQPLLRLLTTSEFLAGMDLVLLLAIGSIFLGIYQINVNVILLRLKTQALPLVAALASGISVVLNITLIPVIGIKGAAISTLASYFVLAVIVTVWSWKIMKYKIDIGYLFKVTGATLIMAAALYFLKVHGVWEIILAIVLGIVILLLGLFILKAFSARDKRLFKRVFGGLIPNIIKSRL